MTNEIMELLQAFEEELDKACNGEPADVDIALAKLSQAIDTAITSAWAEGRRSCPEPICPPCLPCDPELVCPKPKTLFELFREWITREL